jgi:small conductance mechanosensitive channel
LKSGAKVGVFVESGKLSERKSELFVNFAALILKKSIVMLSSLFMVAFAAQVADDGFSKLQIFLQQLIDWGVNAGGRIIGAIIIFVVGRFLISLLRKMLARLLAKRHVDASIQSFVKSLVNILLTILLIIAVIGKLGVETTSFAALWASARNRTG